MNEDTKKKPSPLIFKKLVRIGKDLKAVHMQNMQRYKARHIYDVYNQLQPLLAENGVVLSREKLSDNADKVVSSKGTEGIHRVVWFKFKLTAEDGSCHATEFAGESTDWGDKSMSQCDAMANKQMLIHTFLIPTKDLEIMPLTDDDADTEPAKDVVNLTPRQELLLDISKEVKRAKREGTGGWALEFLTEFHINDFNDIKQITDVEMLKQMKEWFKD